MIDYQKWNHPDFIWAIDVNRLFNDELIQFVKNVTDRRGFLYEQIKMAQEEKKTLQIPTDIPFDENKFFEKNSRGTDRISINRITHIMRSLICKNSDNDCPKNLNKVTWKSKYAYDSENNSPRNSKEYTLFIELKKNKREGH